MKLLFEKYRHLCPFAAYFLLYLTWFAWLEDRFIWRYQIIHMPVDDRIPFCEVFIIPYLLWFAYVAVVVLYQAARDKEAYYRNALFLCIGMTVFLIVSTFWPNGHLLRPKVMPRDNIFTRLVTQLYRVDTATNIWPSIHVFNSIGTHIALCRTNTDLCKNRWIRFGSLVLCVSIILSTVFLKQHSMFDVITAFIMAAVLYVIVYRHDIISLFRRMHVRKRSTFRKRKHA